MQRTLMKRALADIKTAKYAMNTGDEYDLQISAYHIQQCFEKILKQIITEYGLDYTKTYEIASLLHQIPNDQKLLSNNTLDKIMRDEALITKWERVTRYDDPYMASYNLVKELYDMAVSSYNELMSNLEKYDKESKEKESVDNTSIPVKSMNLLD